MSQYVTVSECIHCGQQFRAYTVLDVVCARCLSQGEPPMTEHKRQIDKLLLVCGLIQHVETFRTMAGTGEIRQGGDGFPNKFGSGRTPLSLGLSEGFGPDDIAHFYLRKRLCDDDRAALEQGRINDVSQSRVEYAYREMCEDMVYELGFLTFLPRMGKTLEELWKEADQDARAMGGE